VSTPYFYDTPEKSINTNVYRGVVCVCRSYFDTLTRYAPGLVPSVGVTAHVAVLVMPNMVLLRGAPAGMAAEAELERVVVPRLSGQDGGQPLNELPTQPVTKTSSARSDVVMKVKSATAASNGRLAGGDKFLGMIEIANCIVALLAI
jgi:hypothetical protein